MTRFILACMLLAESISAAPPALTIAYRSDDHAAPLYAACAYARDFSTRYDLHLKQVKPRELYDLYDGPNNALSLRLAGFDSDWAVLNALLTGAADVGVLAAEQVMDAVLAARPVRILAPLQHRGDMLLVNHSVPAADWRGFVAWVKTQTRPVKVGYIARTSAFGTGAADLSMTVLGFEQALDYETLSFGAETARVRLTPAADLPALARDLSQGHMDAAVMQEPEATQAATVRGNRMIGRIDILPPNRFEDRPGTVVAATDSVIRNKGPAVSSFLELLAVATHYANNRTRNTVTATTQWLGTSPAVESIALRNLAFSSLPDVVFADGIWNWYFALRLKHVVPESLAGFMEKKDWLGIPYDSSLVVPALDRAGARIVK